MNSRMESGREGAALSNIAVPSRSYVLQAESKVKDMRGEHVSLPLGSVITVKNVDTTTNIITFETIDPTKIIMVSADQAAQIQCENI